MQSDIKVGDLCKIRMSPEWNIKPFGLDVKTNKQISLSVEEVCLILNVSPHTDTRWDIIPVNKLWARVLIGDSVWYIHSDFLEPLDG